MNILQWRKKNTSSTAINEHPRDVLFGNDDHLIQKLGDNLEENPRIPEVQFGESFGLRGQLLRNLAESELLGIGPPDMVHVTQFDRFHQVETGEYHYLTGLDTSSEATPIAYLNALQLSGGPSKKAGRLSTYCTTNVFSNVDIRIRYESPKHYQINVTDCITGSGNIQLTPKLWEETFVSCFVRSIIINLDRERKIPGLVEFPFAMENGIAYCEKCLALICRYLPRGLELGCDTTKCGSPSFRWNYVLESLLAFLQVAQKLSPFVVNTLLELCEQDPENDICYRTALVAVLTNSEANELKAIQVLSETIQKLFPSGLHQLDQHQLVYAADLLNMQVEFLMSKGDYALALPLAQKTTALCSDNFEAWHKLAKCYIELDNFEAGLFTINALPSLVAKDPCKTAMLQGIKEEQYYSRPLCSGPKSRLHSNEYNFISSTLKAVKDHDLSSMIFGRIVMPPQAKRGCIKELWDGPCQDLGPIYGPQSKNLINFVSPQEVSSLGDRNLLARNSMANQLSWSLLKAYNLLMHIVSKIGWNSLLELRSKIFVMERERSSSQIGELRPEFKSKRLCEKWLDQLFLNLYEDLKITFHNQEHREELYSGLEWELLGLTHLRTWNWADAVPCLRTSIMARFDPISTEKLLDLFISRRYLGSDVLDQDVLLDLVVSKFSYESRFYNFMDLPDLLVLAHLCALSGVETVRNHIYALPSAQKGIVSFMDKVLSYISELNDY